METETNQATEGAECDVCGGEHQTEYCPELGLADPGTVLEFVSRARLTLPDTMQLIETDGMLGVCSNIFIPIKTQLGPFEAKRTNSDIEAVDFFILKMINKDGSVISFDASDENECNWMCLIRPADTSEEQNCMAYTINQNVFFSTTRDILPSEELRVWYAPHYAKKLNRSSTPNGSTRSMLGAIVVTEQPEPAPASQPSNDSEDIPISFDLKLQCSTCDGLFSSESELALHIRDHLNPWGAKKGPFKCKMCPAKFHQATKFKKHVASHEKQHACFMCNFVTKTNSKLKLHMDSKHSVNKRSETNGNDSTVEEKDPKPDKDNSENKENLEDDLEKGNEAEKTSENEDKDDNSKMEAGQSKSDAEDTNTVSADVDIKEAAEGMMSLIKSASSKVSSEQQQEIEDDLTEISPAEVEGNNDVQKDENVTKAISDNVPTHTEANRKSTKPSSAVTGSSAGNKNVMPRTPTERTSTTNLSPLKDSIESTSAKIKEPVEIKSEPESDYTPTRVLPRRTLKGRRTTGKLAEGGDELFSPSKIKVEKPDLSEQESTGVKKRRGRPRKSTGAPETLAPETQAAATEVTATEVTEKEDVVSVIVNEVPKEDVPPDENIEYLDDEDADVDFKPTKEDVKEELSDEEESEESELDCDESEDFKAPKRRGRKRKYERNNEVDPSKKRKRNVDQELLTLEETAEEVIQDDGSVHFKCGICFKSFSQMHYLRLHLPAHTDKYKCPDCGKRFTRNDSFMKHQCQVKTKMFYMKPKSDENDTDLFICIVCNKAFTEEDFVVKHFALHSTRNKCKTCEKIFDSEEEYTKHANGECTGLASNRFPCEICKQSFQSEKHLYRHMAMHTDLFKCEKCNINFSRKDTWQSHILRCNPEAIKDYNIYVCHSCKKTFATQQGANNHMVSCAKHYCAECRTAFQNAEALKSHDCSPGFIDPNLAVQFNCGVCNKSFSSYTYLKRHQATHQGAFECSLCKKGFSRREEYSLHYRFCLATDIIKQKGQIECEVCSASFQVARDYRNHYQEHTHPYKCDNCLKRFIKVGTLHSHKCESIQSQIDNGAIGCDFCGKVFRNVKCLERHQVMHYDPQFECSACNKKFYRRDYLRDHLCKLADGTQARVIRKKNRVIVRKNVVCHECGRAFHNVGNLNKHLKVHGERRYACDLCGKKFHFEGYVKLHKDMVHNKKFSFQCSECGKVLTSKTGLVTHIQRFHTDNPPEYKCDICGKIFRQSGNLRTHRLSHGDEKNYGCEYCGVHFKYPEQRNRHRLEHTMVNKLKCEYCNKQFVRNYDKRRHIEDNHSGLVYICCLCHERCAHRPTLVRHFKRKHPNDMNMVKDPASINSMQRTCEIEVKQEPKDASVLLDAVQQLGDAGLVDEQNMNETTYITQLENGEDIILPQEAAEALQDLSNAVITTNHLGQETITIPNSIHSALGNVNQDGEQTVVILQIINPDDQEIEEEVVDSETTATIEGTMVDGLNIAGLEQVSIIQQEEVLEGVSETMVIPVEEQSETMEIPEELVAEEHVQEIEQEELEEEN